MGKSTTHLGTWYMIHIWKKFEQYWKFGNTSIDKFIQQMTILTTYYISIKLKNKLYAYTYTCTYIYVCILMYTYTKLTCNFDEMGCRIGSGSEILEVLCQNTDLWMIDSQRGVLYIVNNTPPHHPHITGICGTDVFNSITVSGGGVWVKLMDL